MQEPPHRRRCSSCLRKRWHQKDTSRRTGLGRAQGPSQEDQINYEAYTCAKRSTPPNSVGVRRSNSEVYIPSPHFLSPSIRSGLVRAFLTPPPMHRERCLGLPLKRYTEEGETARRNGSVLSLRLFRDIKCPKLSRDATPVAVRATRYCRFRAGNLAANLRALCTPISRWREV